MWMISSLAEKIVSTIFPAQCISCKKEGVSICDKCLQKCDQPLHDSNAYTKSLYSFKDPLIQDIIHKGKYKNRKDLLFVLANHIAEGIRIRYDYRTYILLPMPMYWLRKYIRGYNHAEILAQEIAHILHLPIDTSSLIKSRHTKRQVMSRNKQERLLNQKKSFSVMKDVYDKKFILIDDVTTTGATLSEVRKVLMEAGAKEVIAYTVAH